MNRDLVEAAGQNMKMQGAMVNPTLRENIDQNIQYHLEEAERLKQIKEKLPQLLDVNLRDLREAMNY